MRPARLAGRQVGERHRIRAEEAARIGGTVTDSRARPARYAEGRFSIWNWRSCVPLPSCKVPKFRFSVRAAARKGRRRMVQNGQCCRGRLREVGGIRIAAGKGNGRDAKGGGSGRDGAGPARTWGEAAGPGGDCPQRCTTTQDACGERVVQVVRAGDSEGEDCTVVVTAPLACHPV